MQSYILFLFYALIKKCISIYNMRESESSWLQSTYMDGGDLNRSFFLSLSVSLCVRECLEALWGVAAIDPLSFARLYILRPRHLGQKRQSPRHRHRPRPHWDGEKETRTIHLICDSWLPIGAISERTDGQESEWEAFSDRQRLACASWLLPPPSISPSLPVLLAIYTDGTNVP